MNLKKYELCECVWVVWGLRGESVKKIVGQRRGALNIYKSYIYYELRNNWNNPGFFCENQAKTKHRKYPYL